MQPYRKDTKGGKMKTEREVQTAWEIWCLTTRLSDLLLERYEEDFPDIDPYDETQIHASVPLGLWPS
jgi:hypothetical protein